MFRPLAAAALALLCASAPAMARDAGGLRMHDPATTLDRLQAFDRSGCRLSQTSVTVGINRAFAPGSQARQDLVTDGGSGGCRPLASTSIVAGVNLGLGSRSLAEQTITSRTTRGLLANTQATRGVNIAAGARSSAGQRLIGLTGP